MSLHLSISFTCFKRRGAPGGIHRLCSAIRVDSSNRLTSALINLSTVRPLDCQSKHCMGACSRCVACAHLICNIECEQRPAAVLLTTMFLHALVTDRVQAAMGSHQRHNNRQSKHISKVWAKDMGLPYARSGDRKRGAESWHRWSPPLMVLFAVNSIKQEWQGVPCRSVPWRSA